MCSASKPRVTPMPNPPPPATPVTEDTAAIDARARERRRAGAREGRQSTILAGALGSSGTLGGGAAPTTQAKTVLGQ